MPLNGDELTGGTADIATDVIADIEAGGDESGEVIRDNTDTKTEKKDDKGNPY